ncbi:MAG: pantoate--beta-alanine ligase [Hyphomicrobiales bacterium]|nr:pantoate--beta-alanine ligase [Hyphomicrobiales bacterium]
MAKNPSVVRRLGALQSKVAAWRTTGERIALVPTMGALHEGHLALVRLATRRAARTLVSIFVNPTQFAPNEDYARYPRDQRGDLAKLAPLGVDLVFVPSAALMYPEGFATSVHVAGPAEAGLEDKYRPHFLGGVATVVCKLLTQCRPDIAVFGEKDYQQLLVVRRMARDLDLGVQIVGAKTVREADGLALSSRNAYLDAGERAIAPGLNAALRDAARRIAAGGDVESIMAAARAGLTRMGFRVDYVEARNAETLAPISEPRREPIRLLAAAWLGRTRLIDNIPVGTKS